MSGDWMKWEVNRWIVTVKVSLLPDLFFENICLGFYFLNNLFYWIKTESTLFIISRNTETDRQLEDLMENVYLGGGACLFGIVLTHLITPNEFSKHLPCWKLIIVFFLLFFCVSLYLLIMWFLWKLKNWI